MPGGIDPAIVDIVSSFLSTQIAASVRRYNDARETVLSRGFVPEHPAFAEEVEYEEDHWSCVGNQWTAVRSNWELANT